MTKMTKNTFKLEYDSDSHITYLRIVEDDMTKNHQEADSKVITGFMPQIMDIQIGLSHKMCMICSYENYIGQLNPENEMLWQNILKKPDPKYPNILFGKTHLCHNTLNNFMKRLSETLTLSKMYTNHYI